MKIIAPQVDELEITPPEPPAGFVLRPRDRRRNQVCIAVIAIGMLNFLSYTLLYAALGGDAHNGYRKVIRSLDGTVRAEYYVRGHFLRTIEGREAQVPRWLWIYSYLHSISMWLTSGAMVVSMLIIARPHIIATMRGGWVNGHTFITVLGTITILLTVGAAFVFAWDFVTHLSAG